MVNQFNIKIIIKFYQTIYILSIDYWALMFTSDWASPGVRLRLQKLVRFRLVGKWAKFTFLETIMSHDTISWKNCHIGWVGCDNNRYTLSINFWALLFGSDWASPGVRLRLKKLARFGSVGKWAKFKFLETIMSHDIISWENHHIRWVGCDNNLEGSYTLISL